MRIIDSEKQQYPKLHFRKLILKENLLVDSCMDFQIETRTPR